MHKRNCSFGHIFNCTFEAIIKKKFSRVLLQLYVYFKIITIYVIK